MASTASRPNASSPSWATTGPPRDTAAGKMSPSITQRNVTRDLLRATPVYPNGPTGVATGRLWLRGRADELRRGHLEVGLVHPPAGVGGTVPLLQGDGVHGVALLVLEDFREGFGVPGADLGRGPAQKQQAIGPLVLEHGD